MNRPAVVAFGLRERLATSFADGSGVVDDIRAIKAPAELELIRTAGRLSEIIAEAAFAAARTGVREQEVAAAAYRRVRQQFADFRDHHSVCRLPGEGRVRTRRSFATGPVR